VSGNCLNTIEKCSLCYELGCKSQNRN
jgi:hypothetical protein